MHRSNAVSLRSGSDEGVSKCLCDDLGVATVFEFVECQIEDGLKVQPLLSFLFRLGSTFTDALVASDGKVMHWFLGFGRYDETATAPCRSDGCGLQRSVFKWVDAQALLINRRWNEPRLPRRCRCDDLWPGRWHRYR